MLLHKVFSKGVDERDTFEPESSEHSFIYTLASMTMSFSDEEARHNCLNVSFNNYFTIQPRGSVDANYTTDGHAFEIRSPISNWSISLIVVANCDTYPRFRVCPYYRDYTGRSPTETLATNYLSALLLVCEPVSARIAALIPMVLNIQALESSPCQMKQSGRTSGHYSFFER